MLKVYDYGIDDGRPAGIFDFRSKRTLNNFVKVPEICYSNDFPTFDLNFKDSYEKNSVFYVATTIGYESY